jgi:hypothetical protein
MSSFLPTSILALEKESQLQHFDLGSKRKIPRLSAVIVFLCLPFDNHLCFLLSTQSMNDKGVRLTRTVAGAG